MKNIIEITGLLIVGSLLTLAVQSTLSHKDIELESLKTRVYKLEMASANKQSLELTDRRIDFLVRQIMVSRRPTINIAKATVYNTEGEIVVEGGVIQ
uniref:Uncharacterized protein n=1 Tax=viral metagenome TaxID=1070528 RepID=A0A6M3IGU2_9ZZZZ